MEVDESTTSPRSKVENDIITLTTFPNIPEKIKSKIKKNFLGCAMIIIISILVIFSLFLYIEIKKLLLNPNNGLILNYDTINPDDETYTYIPIAHTNDIHGRLFPTNHEIYDGKKIITYSTGGLIYLARYLSILREEFGDNRVLFFDSGDKFKNGVNLYENELINDIFNLMGLDGSTLGNHEFDHPREWVEKILSKAEYKILLNNLKNSKTNKIKGSLGKNVESSYIYNMYLENGDIIKIGVIGLTFNMKNDKNISGKSAKTWDEIEFFNYMTGLENESKKLKKNGANAVILLCHLGLMCDDQKEILKLNMYTKNTKQKKCNRNDSDSVLYKILDNIKPGIIDAILGGDSHNEVHHWENNIPIVSTNGYSLYFNVLYLPFIKNTKTNEYRLVNNKIQIEGPMPICEKIFKNYQNCEPIPSKEYKKAGDLINFTWHNLKMKKDSIIKKFPEKYFEIYNTYETKEITKFIGYDDVLEVDKSGDCMLCNLIADTIKDIKNTDFSIINVGAFADKIIPGKITQSHFYNFIPFDNYLCTIELTGNEFLTIIKAVQIGKYAFYSTSGILQTVQISKIDNVKKIIDVKIFNNGVESDIQKDQIYKVAGTDYLFYEGGNDFEKPEVLNIIKQKLNSNKISCSKEVMYIEISKYFEMIKEVDVRTYVDKKHPRVKKIFK